MGLKPTHPMHVHTSFFYVKSRLIDKLFDETICCVQKWDDTYIQAFRKKKTAFSVTDVHQDM